MVTGLHNHKFKFMRPPRLDRFVVAVFILSIGLGSIFVFRGAIDLPDRKVYALADDAMISMRFAKNFAAGEGLVFNPGGRPVEGYTNFLWTIIMAMVHLAPGSLETRSLVISLLGIFILAANTAIALSLAKCVFPSLAKLGLERAVAAAVAFYYPLIFWTLRGFEVGLISLGVSAMLVLALQLERKWSWKATSGLMAIASGTVLCRIDAVLPCACICIYLFTSRSNTRQLRLATMLIVVAGTLTVSIHTWWRWKYYGQLLPNTYYLKMEHVPLMTRLARGGFMALIVLVRHLFFWVMLASLSIALNRHSENRRPVMLLISVFAVQVLYSIWVGGDAWESLGFANRFLAVGAVPLLLLSAAGLGSLINSTQEQIRMLSSPISLTLRFVGCACLIMAIGSFLTNRKLPAPFSNLAFGKQLLISLLLGAFVLAVLLGGYLASVGVRLLAGATSRFYSPSQLSSKRAMTVLAFLILCLQLPSWASWAVNNFQMYEFDVGVVGTAYRVRQATGPDETIAVSAAGSIPYFSERQAIDLLGKSDQVIAHQEPHLSKFIPGHSKWDLTYSIGKLRPDIIVDLPPQATADDIKYVLDLGYRQDRFGFLRRPGSLMSRYQ